MISMETFHAITVLRRSGKGTRSIAKMLGLSRNTVRKYLREGEPPQYKQIANPPPDKALTNSKSRWQLHHDAIVQMWLVKSFSGSRIMSELRRAGAGGSDSAFYAYFRKLKADHGASKARMRYEMPAGSQCQFDWSPYKVRIGGEIRKVNVFLTILSHSRFKFAVSGFDTKLPMIFDALEKAFSRFGGTTKTMLMDNARQMVTESDRKRFAWNRRFLLFMEHFGIEPKACKVRHPWTKGKVENPFKYIENHFIKGNEFSSLDSFNKALSDFLETWQKSMQKGIMDIPANRLEKEQPELQALPESAFVDSILQTRRVSNDCLISMRGNRYSVPHTFATTQVWVREIGAEKLEILSAKLQLVATHTLQPGTGGIYINDDHYRGLNPHNTVSTAGVLFSDSFGRHQDFLAGLKKYRRLSWKTDITNILNLTEMYGQKQVSEALSQAVAHSIFNPEYIMMFLGKHATVMTPSTLSSRSLIPQYDAELVRDPAHYDRIGGHDGISQTA